MPEPGLSQGSAHGKIVAVATHSRIQGGCGKRTIIARHVSQLQARVPYTCAGCGDFISSEELDFPEVGPSGFRLYGDESTAKDIAVYGLLLFSIADVKAAETNSADIMRVKGLPPGTRFHCREIFSGDARSKTAWRDFTESQVWEVARQLLIGLKNHRGTFYIGKVDSRTYPALLPSGFGYDVTVLPEHLYVLAFAAAMNAFSESGLTRNIIKELDVTLWTDPQRSRIDFWGIGNVQVQRMMNWYGLKPKKISDRKPLLIDAADIFAYVSARALSSLPSRNKARCEELYQLCHPIEVDAWWGPGQILNSSQLGRG